MVRVTGQLDAPLVDIGAMQEEYWERREVTLPSLAKLHQPKGWRKWFYKQQAPKIVLKRLSTEDWHRINSEFHGLKKEIFKDLPKTRELSTKALRGEDLTEDEVIYLTEADQRIRPVSYSMLSSMIVEPEMTYDDVVLMFEFLDDFDEQTLMAFANQMSSEKAEIMTAVMQERTQELNQLSAEMRASI
tara:strand:- start:412 stop:975 length:564 start_codon:yes stop_codon:yes gene_type:complete